MDGTKERYISRQHTSTQIIQIDMQGMICTQRKNEEHLHGVIESCGMEGAFNNCPMSVENLGSQIIDRFIAYFGPRLSPTKVDLGKP